MGRRSRDGTGRFRQLGWRGCRARATVDFVRRSEVVGRPCRAVVPMMIGAPSGGYGWCFRSEAFPGGLGVAVPVVWTMVKVRCCAVFSGGVLSEIFWREGGLVFGVCWCGNGVEGFRVGSRW